MERNNLAIIDKEIEKSNIDAQTVNKLIIPKSVMFDPLQKSMLIGYFTNRDIFLNKLITLLSVYLDSCKQCITLLQSHDVPDAKWTSEEVKLVKESSDNAFKMAHMILNDLKDMHQKFNDGNDSGKSQTTKRKYQLSQYRFLDTRGRAQLLVDYEGQVRPIEEKLKQQEAQAKAKGIPPDPQLFKAVHQRIYLILKSNYLDDFYQKVAQIPTKIFRKNSCTHGHRFNSIGYDIGGAEDGDVLKSKGMKGMQQSSDSSYSRETQNSKTSNQWILKRQTAMTSTHKPVNIISYILDKKMKKEQREMGSMIGGRKSRLKVDGTSNRMVDTQGYEQVP